MNNHLSRLLLLPSLVIANLYLFIGGTGTKADTNIIPYSEKIKSNSNKSQENVSPEVTLVEDKKNLKNTFTVSFNLILISIFSFSSINKLSLKYQNYIYKNKILVLINTRISAFNFIKSLMRIFHNRHQKIFFYSFSS